MSPLYVTCTGKSTNFVHQHFYESYDAQKKKKGTTAAALTDVAPTSSYWTSLTSYLQCCACPWSCKLCACKCCSCGGMWCCWGKNTAEQDCEGSNIDDADLEAGLGVGADTTATERTPLISSSAKSEPARINTYSATSSAKASITSTSAKGSTSAAEDGLIRDRTEVSPVNTEADDDDEQDDLDLPDSSKPTDSQEVDLEAQTGTKSSKGGEKEGKRRRKKKPLTLYGSAMQAMGMAPTKIEHAQEVQLFTSDLKPAGKVYIHELTCFVIFVCKVLHAVKWGATQSYSIF